MSDINELVQRIREERGSKREAALSELLELARLPEFISGVFESLAKLCQRGTLTSDDLLPHVPAVLEIWQSLHAQSKDFQGDPNKVEWMFEDVYQPIRTRMEWLLDVLGYFPGENIARALREGLKLSDPLLQLFAALSLLRRLELVEAADLESIAANHQTRQKLWKQLRELEMESLMPEKWSMPELIAASELVNWASHPMELGVPPEEVELIKRFPVEVNGTKGNVYLFRFREFPKPWESGEGWMAGIAGPYRDGQPVLSPWSSFDDWNSMSPEEHFSKLFSAVSE